MQIRPIDKKTKSAVLTDGGTKLGELHLVKNGVQFHPVKGEPGKVYKSFMKCVKALMEEYDA